MLAYIVRRLSAAVVQVAVVLVITFVLVRLTPGDPVSAYLSRVQSEATASPAYIAQIRHELALDRPVPVQFWQYIVRVVRGNLGVSYTQSEPVLNVISDQLPYTVELAFASMFIAVTRRDPARRVRRVAPRTSGSTISRRPRRPSGTACRGFGSG